VEQDQAIRTGTAASVIAHLSLLALLLLLSNVSPLDSAPESIAVNIVTPAEIEPEKPGPTEPPQPALPEPSALERPTPPASEAPAPAAPQPASKPQQAATPQPAQPDRRTAAAPPPVPPPSPSPAQPPAPAPSPSAGYTKPEPDLSVKYNVVLGLPPELPPLAPAPSKSDQGFDETTVDADISSSVIAGFRRHLKSCSKLPASVQPSDHVKIKLRVFLTQDGRLAAEPAVGGGSANVKAIELLKSAIAGLKQCQPYSMLPADRYGEWKVLDLDFTPKDFSG
jgi:outer membrane biosynthesis protein TonB